MTETLRRPSPLPNLDRAWERVYMRGENPVSCYLCGLMVDPYTGVLDHVIPRSQGGSDRWRNRRLAHKWCDKTKLDRSPMELIDALEEQLQTGRNGRGNVMTPEYRALAERIVRHLKREGWNE